MNMNILINRQDEEADECWPVTFVLPNISTEDEPCPGSVNTTGSLKKPEEANPLFIFCYSVKGTAARCISVLFFPAPKLSHYH